MKVQFQVAMKDEDFEEFFALVCGFDKTHEGVTVMMVAEGDKSGEEVRAIFDRVLPGGEIVLLTRK